MKAKTKDAVVIDPEYERELEAQTRDGLLECRAFMASIEGNPLPNDPTYTLLLDRAVKVFESMSKVLIDRKGKDALDRNGAVALARVSLERIADQVANLHAAARDAIAADQADNTQRTLTAIMQEVQTTRGELAADVKRAADAAELTAAMIGKMRPEWFTGEKKAPRPYINAAGNIKMEIYDLWQSYDHNPEDNGGRQADYKTFFEMDGGKEVRTGVTLQSFIEDMASKDPKNRTPDQLLKRIIKSEGARRRAITKQKTKPRQKQRVK